MSKPLNLDEERILVEAAKTGDIHARNKVIMNLYSTVRWMVSKQMRYSPGEREDAVQFVISVLCEKYVKFDVSRNVRFSTYASYWIRESLHVFRMKRSMIRVPEYLYKKRKKELNKNPSQDIDGWLKVHPLEIGNGHAGISFRETLPSREEEPDYYLERAEEYDRLSEMIDELSPREKEVLLRRSQGEKLWMIGEKLGLTKERIRQIENVVIEKLRSSVEHSSQ